MLKDYITYVINHLMTPSQTRSFRVHSEIRCEYRITAFLIPSWRCQWYFDDACIFCRLCLFFNKHMLTWCQARHYILFFSLFLELSLLFIVGAHSSSQLVVTIIKRLCGYCVLKLVVTCFVTLSSLLLLLRIIICFLYYLTFYDYIIMCW